MSDDRWVEVGCVEELAGRLPHVFLVDDERILITREGGTWTAVTLRCPHKGAQMQSIDYRDGKLACPFHGWIFDLDAAGAEVHGYSDLLAYELRTENGTLYVRVE